MKRWHNVILGERKGYGATGTARGHPAWRRPSSQVVVTENVRWTINKRLTMAELRSLTTSQKYNEGALSGLLPKSRVKQTSNA